ncbi:MAG: tagaturonate epimerase family protein, partial [Bacteroidales bacterium]
MKLDKYSFGVGDRFGREGKAQLRAIQEINRLGFPVVPVWNKSNREHELVGTTQKTVKQEADEAVKANKWKGNYYVDADHITLNNVDKFLDYSDFYTIDVAHFIGHPVETKLKADFLKRTANHSIPGFVEAESNYDFGRFADTYLTAIHEVKKLHEYILSKKPDGFIAEISMDEVQLAQSPLDLYFILKELKHLNVEPQTIAPKFTGLFAKGVDYEGDTELFAKEFEQDIRILQAAKDQLEFHHEVKLSIHSGSDKFSIYPIIRDLVEKYEAGIHIKTAGTTWLEEVIGLARGGGEGLRIAKEIYHQGMIRFDELSAPYLSVLHIDSEKLPPSKEVLTWSSAHFANTLIHEQTCRDYNPHFRQLIHISYKAAAEMGKEFMDALDYYRDPIEEQVYT